MLESSKNDRSDEKELISVSKFILLLYLQNVHSVEQCSSTYLEEEFLSFRSSGHSMKVFDEIKYFKFVKNYIEEMVDLIEDKGRGRLSLLVMDTFGLLIEGLNDTRIESNMRNLVLKNREKLGYMSEKGNETLSAEAFSIWVKSHLEVNPFGLAALNKNGQKLPWLHNSATQERKNSTRNALIVTNAHSVPVKKKIVSFNRIVNQTVAQMSRILHGSTVHIQQCRKSFVYLLSPMRALRIENCHNCTLVLGPVATTLEIVSCKDLRIVAISRRIQIRKSGKCTLYILTPTQPLLLENQNSEITLAPHNTFYPKLEEHMAAAGISKNLNLWDSPLLLDKRKDNTNVCRIMPVQEFSLFSIPFRMEGSTKDIITNIPPQYIKRVEMASAKYKKWTIMLGSTPLNDDENKQLQTEIHLKFWDWCTNNGNDNELLTLQHYIKQCQHKQSEDV